MKCENIHKTLDDSNLRDVLSKMANGCWNGSVEHIERQIKELQERLVKAKEGEAAVLLIKRMGWAEYDVSDQVEDYHRDRYFNFVGTEEERRSVFVA